MIVSGSLQEKMSQTQMNLCLGGIRLTVKCIAGFVLEEAPKEYGNFISQPDEAGSDVPVFIHPGVPDHLSSGKGEAVFATGRTWSLFRDGSVYSLTLHDAYDRPSCIVSFDKKCGEMHVYCSDSFLGESAAGYTTVANPFFYPLDRLMMMYILSQRQGVMMHAAGIVSDGRGFLFPGRSGAGKSTLSRMFLSRRGAKALSDERIIVRKVGSGIRIFGTPWPGDAGIALNEDSPLSFILFPVHGADNNISELDRGETLNRLLPLGTIPWYDPVVMSDVLSFCEYLIASVPSYELRFTVGEKVIDVLEEFSHSM